MGSRVQAASRCRDSGPAFGEVSPEVIEAVLVRLATENERHLSELPEGAGCFKEAQIVGEARRGWPGRSGLRQGVTLPFPRRVRVPPVRKVAPGPGGEVPGGGVTRKVTTVPSSLSLSRGPAVRAPDHSLNPMVCFASPELCLFAHLVQISS